MNASCNVIQDLLPLYHDGVCSEDSRKMVEEHLKTCEKCGKMNADLDIEIEAPEQKAADKKALKDIRRKMRKKMFTALIAGIALVLAGLLVWKGVEYGMWYYTCRTLYEEVIVPMEPDTVTYSREATQYDTSTMATEKIDGVPEFRTDASAYGKEVDGFRLSVSVPSPGQDVSILSVSPIRLTHYVWDEDYEEMPLQSLHLSILYPCDPGSGYEYYVHMQDGEKGVYANLVVDRYGNLMYIHQMTDLEVEHALTLLTEYRVEIQEFLDVAQEVWPFLTE